MRILVVSDVHGRGDLLQQAIDRQPTARDILFLGDGLRQAEEAEENNPDRTFYMVPGNCDFGSALPKSQVEIFGGKRFYFTHGHIQQVKYGLTRLDYAAREMQADIVLFGHTHVPYEHYEDGLTYFNPGSLGYGRTYGYVDVVGGGLRTAVVEL